MALLIPAAGLSRRMRGGDKLLELVDGVPQLRRICAAARTLPGPVVVTVPAADHPRAQALADVGAILVPVPDRAEGMAASLRRGIAALPPGTPAAMIVPGDMPDLAAADLAAIAQAFDPDAPTLVQATAADGTPGHPVLFPADCFDALATVAGDSGARDVLRAHRARLRHVALHDRRALTDLDTPEAWAAWRAERPGRT
ncbi:4-diphosphocytidyl-2C-methyl-D-erythritol synthase [Roseivivax isoporae LMG 25204]|uniref:4-diphosphocytidyl-2C-methyl-D-erythritol synthase n=1 Tax=Roseivivax isoporae LMG 25204 TaxID=1449351 RepID=X7FEX2_9RHOB|nr:4-diphosphocytidyl-2C-methyl-D-erythritol synthase [Roseivivax isoporae LMG 25204]